MNTSNTISAAQHTEIIIEGLLSDNAMLKVRVEALEKMMSTLMVGAEATIPVKKTKKTKKERQVTKGGSPRKSPNKTSNYTLFGREVRAGIAAEVLAENPDGTHKERFALVSGRLSKLWKSKTVEEKAAYGASDLSEDMVVSESE